MEESGVRHVFSAAVVARHSWRATKNKRYLGTYRAYLLLPIP
jgi:hypothetical protein